MLVKWDQKFEELLAIIDKNAGVLPEDSNDGEFRKLYDWYYRQRGDINSLTHEQQEKIKSIKIIKAFNKVKLLKLENYIQEFIEFRKNNPDRMPRQYGTKKQERNLHNKSSVLRTKKK